MPIVLHINVSKNRGSTGKIAEQLCEFAEKYGWESYLVHGHRYYLKGGVKGFVVTGIIGEWFHYLKSLLTDGQGLSSRFETKSLLKWMGKVKPDIIHLHNIHGYYINYPILFRYLNEQQIPVIWTLHDCWPFTGHCAYFDRIGCEKWLSQCNNCPQISSYPKSLIDRSARNYELKKKMLTSIPNMTIVPVSDWLRDLVARSFFSKYPIQTIHNGIDLNQFRPSVSDFRKRNALEDKFVVLGVADGYGERKGLLDFNILCEKLGSSVKIILVGLRGKDKKKVSPRIMGMARTENQQELIDIYSSADVYINPTYEDNFPTTNIEALACGTPVITYRTGGSPEAVDDNTGFVVEKGDIEGLVSAIEIIMNKGKSAFSEACRVRAEAYFNKDHCFAEYVRLYEGLIGEK